MPPPLRSFAAIRAGRMPIPGRAGQARLSARPPAHGPGPAPGADPALRLAPDPARRPDPPMPLAGARMRMILLPAGLSLLLHVSALALVLARPVAPATEGGAGQGDGGFVEVTLAPAGSALAEMLANWDTPPAVPPEVPQPLPEPEHVAQETPVAVPADRATAPPHAREPVAALAAPQAPEAALAAPDNPPAPSAPLPARAAAKTPDPRPAASPARPAAPAGLAQGGPVPAQQAAGRGGGGRKGAADAGGGGSAAASARSRWAAEIGARIERKKSYPRAAGGAGGTVTLRLSVTRTGELAGLAVARSSGNAALDAAAVAAVRRAGRFPAAPASLTAPRYNFALPVTFRP